MLKNKNIALMYDSKIISLQIELDSEIDFYLAPIKFDDASFFNAVTANKDLFNRDLFIHQDMREYVRLRQRSICNSFSITAMLFTNLARDKKVSKHVIVCTGSIFHAPRLFYRDESSGKTVYERSSEYLDLL